MKFARIQRAAVLLVLLILIAVFTVKLSTDPTISFKSSPSRTQSQAGYFTDHPTLATFEKAALNAPAGGILPAAAHRPKVVLPDELVAAMSWKTSDLKVITHPDGRQSMNLNGRLTHVSASVIGPDGKEVVRCFSSADALAEALSQTSPSK